MDSLKQYFVILFTFPILANIFYFLPLILNINIQTGFLSIIFELLWLPLILAIFVLPVYLYIIISKDSESPCKWIVYHIHLIITFTAFLILRIFFNNFDHDYILERFGRHLLAFLQIIPQGLILMSIILLVNSIRFKNWKFILYTLSYFIIIIVYYLI